MTTCERLLFKLEFGVICAGTPGFDSNENVARKLMKTRRRKEMNESKKAQ